MNRFAQVPLLLVALLFAPFHLWAVDAGAEAAIRAVLANQTEAWNRGDLASFVRGYADDCLFAGKAKVVRGRSQVLARYRQTYSGSTAMGKLTFTNLEFHDIQPGQSAFAFGQFHLERTAAGGGAANGIFTLVFKKLNGTWQILLDHSS